jgi:hypothetical protein
MTTDTMKVWGALLQQWLREIECANITIKGV